VVDREQYVIRMPPELASVGVLSEPLSVAEKAIDEAAQLQTRRLPDAPANPDWLHSRRCLVAGLGPIGLLAALALRLRGAEVYGLDVVDAGTARPLWLTHIGGQYVDGRQVPADRVDDNLGPMELIFEATGVALLEFNLLDALAHAHLCWGDHVAKLISHRYPYTDFETALGQHPADEIKTVIGWEA
jgi:threonine dehydrogenase-like Zn-dependent dehydrogenase